MMRNLAAALLVVIVFFAVIAVTERIDLSADERASPEAQVVVSLVRAMAEAHK